MLIEGIGVPVETGIFSGKAPEQYVVITPMNESFVLFADNAPHAETQEVRLSLFSKSNYQSTKNKLVKSLLQADFVITNRQYIEHEDDTDYHHYAIDVIKEYLIERTD